MGNLRKLICSTIMSMCMIVCLTSCSFDVYATTQDDIYVETSEDIVQSDVDVNVVIRYGQPYYYNGSLLYYMYMH